jgi:hypothetical protein
MIPLRDEDNVKEGIKRRDLEDVGTSVGQREMKRKKQVPHFLKRRRAAAKRTLSAKTISFQCRGAAANRAPSAKTKPLGMTIRPQAEVCAT